MIQCAKSQKKTVSLQNSSAFLPPRAHSSLQGFILEHELPSRCSHPRRIQMYDGECEKGHCTKGMKCRMSLSAKIVSHVVRIDRENVCLPPPTLPGQW